MSKRSAGLILLAALSIGLGVFTALLFFHSFESTLSEQCLQDGNRGSATAAARTLVYGLATGGALFLWSLLVILIAPLFRRKPPVPTTPPEPDKQPTASADQPRT